ncbi:MAG: heavy metal translocating P-type ATPase, partial [Pseudomonadales bacterium]
VEAVGKNMRISRIKQLLEQAQYEKPKVEELAQRVALWFVLAVLSIAAMVWLFWHFTQAELALAITLSVLVVSCPCALSLATPTAITAATNALRQYGLLVTRRTVWETMPLLKHVIFDKTGTLTHGRIKVEEVEVAGNVDEQQCLGIAAALERGSSHPMASAFAGYDIGLQVSSLHNETGQGVQAVVDGGLYRLGGVSFVAGICNVPAQEKAQNCVLLTNQHGLLARFKLRDELRPEAAAVIRQLQDNNLSVHLLSGDASGAAADVAAQLGISHVIEGAQPQDKLDYVQTLQGTKQEKVMMVGDGINDIPVLATADVSLAMLDASDLAKTSADCILLTPSLAILPALFEKASQTSKTIRQNLLWALLYNASAIPLAALGFVPPYLAAIGMSASSIIVVANSLRLWPRRGNDGKR